MRAIIHTSQPWAVFILLCCLCTSPQAQDNTVYDMQQYRVYYNVFNSTLIPAEVANAHHLKRSTDQAYLNVALVKKTGDYGMPARLTGQYRNLMQQTFPLRFIEINESTATYYLAPIRFNNEEILHIDITAAPLDNSESARFTITKKLYRD